jgi:hypothetical protein
MNRLIEIPTLMTASPNLNDNFKDAHAASVPAKKAPGAVNGPSLKILQDGEKLEQRRAEEKLYYDQQIENIRFFLKTEKFEVAEVLFEYLLELKKDKFRKNDYTPGHGHEIDQLLPLLTSLSKGDLKDKRADIEALYETIEKWIIGILVHDLGEDYAIFPADLRAVLAQKLKDRYGFVSESNRALIDRAARSMERLTHYRKFSPAEFENLAGEPLGQLDFEKRGVIQFTGKVKKLIADKMELRSKHRDHFQLFAVKDKKGVPRIIATQFGRSDGLYGADWNSYIYCLMETGLREENDFYDFMVKLGDRNQGMGSRVAMKKFRSLRKFALSGCDRNTVFVSECGQADAGYSV